MKLVKNLYELFSDFNFNLSNSTTFKFYHSEESNEKIRFQTFYDLAIPLAAQMIDHNETLINCAIIGRWRKLSTAGFLSSAMVGNSSLLLDSDEKTNFCHIGTIECKVVIIDCTSLSSDIE